MKFAADFRRIAREALAGRWGVAVIAGLVATLLGAMSTDVDLAEVENNFNISGEYVGYIAVFALVITVVYIVVGSFVEVGYAKFNLNLVDRRPAEVGDLFSYASICKKTVVTRILIMIYTFLWMLLFIIPGIVAVYSYAMTPYILAENPNLTAKEAINRSKQMMIGNRFRLFCLQLSFIGWAILAAFTFGIGVLWLTPYEQAATAAFYREVSGTEIAADTVIVAEE